MPFSFTSGSYAPFNFEIADVTRKNEGIGYAHVYGAFNIAYGLGGSVGPIIGGQIFDHVRTALGAFVGVGEESSARKAVQKFCHLRKSSIWGQK
ncbi:hypothetical protein L218DRAFT_262391 [Marasmius fiardii PR-910]|nr:hypothetical protein L218DRAFT_262391 [Marasmius fiardii PR-910]